MSKKKVLRCIIAYLILAAGIVLFFILNVGIGSVKISFREIVDIFFLGKGVLGFNIVKVL